MISVKPPRTLSVEETAAAQALLARARAAMADVADADQATVDRWCRAVALDHRTGRCRQYGTA
jgi:hypothetical protein